MVVHNFDVNGIRGDPPKANSPLVVDPDAVLPGAIAAECFETIPGNRAEIGERRSRVNLSSFRFVTAAIWLNFRLNSRRKTFSVSLSRKDRIPVPEYYHSTYNARR
jgi:hypothetical protein